jgi:hypothetical protein
VSGPTTTPTFGVLYQTEGCLFGSFQNVIVAIWKTQATGPLAAKLGELAGAFSKAHPEGFSSVQVISNSPPLPTGEAREKLIAMTRLHSATVACIGTVLEGSGFWASAVRSFIVGIRLVVPRTFEMQTYASIPELARWLAAPHAARTGVTLDPREVERALMALRDKVT